MKTWSAGWVSLNDVHKSSAAKKTVTYSIAPVYVVNFDSSFSYPQLFMYTACSKSLGYKRVCGKSRVLHTICHHDCESMYTYRFDLVLVDKSHACQPLRAQIRHEVSNFLRMQASDFRNNTEAEQIVYVQKLTSQTPTCYVMLKVVEGIVSIKTLSNAYPYPIVPSLQPPLMRSLGCPGRPIEMISTPSQPRIPGSSTMYVTRAPSGSSTVYNLIKPDSSVMYTTTQSGCPTAYTLTPSDVSTAEIPCVAGSLTATPNPPNCSTARTTTLRRRATKNSRIQQLIERLVDVLKDANLDDEAETSDSLDPVHEGDPRPDTLQGQ